MFQRYTESARRAIFYARHETGQFGSRTIETQYLLLGVWREHEKDPRFRPGSPALAELRAEIEQRWPPTGKAIPTNIDLPLSHSSKRVLAYAADEANRLKHGWIDNRHLLAGLLREKDGVAAEMLGAHGLTLESARKYLTEQGGASQ